MPKRAWVYQRGRSWYVGWYDTGGHRRRRSVGTKWQADAYRRELEHRLNADLWVEPVRLPWAKFWQDYTTDPAFLGLAPSSRQLHEYCERHLRELCEIRYLRDITPELVADYRRRRAAEVPSPRTVNKDLSLIRTWLNRAVKLGLIDRNPALAVSMLKTAAPRIRVVPYADYQALRRAAMPTVRSRRSRHRHLRFLMDILWFCGLSTSDALALEVGQFDLAAWTLAVRRRKTGRSYTMPLPADEWFSRRLRRYLKVAAAKYHGKLFAAWQKRNMNLSWDNACRRAGVRATRHDFRRTFASNLAMAGVPMPAVQRLMGHASILTTAQHYTNVDATLRQAMALAGRGPCIEEAPAASRASNSATKPMTHP